MACFISGLYVAKLVFIGWLESVQNNCDTFFDVGFILNLVHIVTCRLDERNKLYCNKFIL